MIPNSPIKRFKYIVKTYGERYPEQVLDTLVVLSDTVGEDHILRHNWAAFAWDRLPEESRPGDVDGQRMAYQDYLEAAEVWVDDNPRTRRKHDSDALWPWVARNLVKIRKREGGRKARQWAGRLFGKAPALTQWQKAERIDLGRYSIDQALEALEDFEVDADNIPQGEIVYEFDDGWTVQKLWDRDIDTLGDMIFTEGEVMQHCLKEDQAGPEYRDDVIGGSTALFSLRDPAGKPHATAELSTELNRFIQVMGKQNAEPKPEYAERVKEFAQKAGIILEGLTDEETASLEQWAAGWARELWFEACMNDTIYAVAGQHPHTYPDYDEVVSACLPGDPQDWLDLDLEDVIEDVVRSAVHEEWERQASENEELFRQTVEAAAEWAESSGEIKDRVDLYEYFLDELHAAGVSFQGVDVDVAVDQLAWDFDEEE